MTDAIKENCGIKKACWLQGISWLSSLEILADYRYILEMTKAKFIQGRGISKPSCFSIRMQSHSLDHTELGRNGKLDRRENPETRLMNMKGIDLIHDTRYLNTRSAIDGIKIVSRGISGGKQGLKFAYTSNHSQFCSFFQNKNTFLVLQNV